MPSGCVVPGCHSGTYLDIRKSRDAGERPKSLFSVPKCPISLRRWQDRLRMMNKTLTPKSRICEIHFHQEDVIRNDEIRLVDGSVHKIPRQNYKLRNEAIPIAIRNVDHMYAKVYSTDVQDTVKQDYVEQDILTRNVQFDNNDDMGAPLLSPEVIPRCDSGQVGLMVRSEEGSDSTSTEQLLYNYSAMQLKEDIENQKLNMPSGWAYIFEETLVKFIHVHPVKCTIHLLCMIDKNMKVQIATFDSRIILDVDERFCTSTDVVNYLNRLAKKMCCDGTGIGSSYSESCHGFILDDDVYERSRGYQRCISCRKFRRIQQCSKQDLENNETLIKDKKHKLKASHCMNARLKKKVFSKIIRKNSILKR